MSNINVKIPDEDFRIIKKGFVVKPHPKHIVELYNNMNDELDNLKLGYIDNHHPEIIEGYHKRQRQNWKLMNFFGYIGGIFR